MASACTLAVLLGFSGAPYYFLQLPVPAVIITVVDVLLLTLCFPACCCACWTMDDKAKSTKQDVEKAPLVAEKRTVVPPECARCKTRDEDDRNCTHCGLGLVCFCSYLVVAVLVCWWAATIGLVCAGNITNGPHQVVNATCPATTA